MDNSGGSGGVSVKWGEVTSGQVTVTTINIQHHPHEKEDNNFHSTQCNGIITSGKCSVVVSGDQNSVIDEDSSVDAEVSNFTSDPVNLRNKKTRENDVREPIERPMSWEGELSDSEVIVPKKEPEEESMESSQPFVNGINTNSVITHVNDEKQSIKAEITNEKPIENNSRNLTSQSELPLLVDKLLSNGYTNHTNGLKAANPTPSPDSAVYSCYSPQASPVTSRHILSSSSGISSPFTPSLSRNNSDASQYGGSQHSSCYSHSYSSVSVSPTQFSPTHSPIQGRHIHRAGFPSPVPTSKSNGVQEFSNQDELTNVYDKLSILNTDVVQYSGGLTSPGISRQQLINSPCPICGDKISGFHYGIFSCESCKGFFKRTVQNRKNYVCLRGSLCPVTIATRKKCPACRFDKCLNMGMKLEAIREDRTRGGRSTYQCSYTVPQNIVDQQKNNVNNEQILPSLSVNSTTQWINESNSNLIPPLLQEIMEVEHLWQYNGSDPKPNGNLSSLAGTDLGTNLCTMADHRLYKIVKWCKSLPLFKNITIDDQIALLINSWCELLLFSCCFRSMSSPGEIRISLGKCISLAEARNMGLGPPIERMLNFTDHLRRLRVDRYEYVAMKVIVLLTSDTSDLKEPEKVRSSQEKALQALQQYTIAHYPDIPSKFGELLLRIPDLQRTCQVGKDMLSIKSQEGEGPSFNLLMELLRGEH